MTREPLDLVHGAAGAWNQRAPAVPLLADHC